MVDDPAHRPPNFPRLGRHGRDRSGTVGLRSVTGSGGRARRVASPLRARAPTRCASRRRSAGRRGARRASRRRSPRCGAARSRPPTRGRAPARCRRRGRCAARSGRRGGRRRAAAARTTPSAAWPAGGRGPRRTRTRTGSRAGLGPTPVDRTAAGRRRWAAAPAGARAGRPPLLSTNRLPRTFSTSTGTSSPVATSSSRRAVLPGFPGHLGSGLAGPMPPKMSPPPPTPRRPWAR